jgi:hypothetical protein
LIIIDFYNVKTKVFQDGVYQVVTYSRAVVYGKPSARKGKKVQKRKYTCDYKQNIRIVYKSSADSKRRTKNMIYDIARSNKWDWFITLTFNPELVNSLDYEECTKKLSKWLNNLKRITGSGFKYIVIPELHKSGRYHFHGLFANCDNLDFKFSGKFTDKGLPIFNIGKYKLGFTTATKVQDNNKVALYISKYITKDMTAVTSGKKKYWASRNCNKPTVIKNYLDNKDNALDFELHGDLINNPDYVNMQHKGKKDGGFIRYYEFNENMGDMENE